MTRWQDIKELTKKDESVWQRVSLIFSQHNFPVEIRELFSEWFEEQVWDVEIDESQDAEPEVHKHAESLLGDLLERISTMSKSSRELVSKINLNTYHSQLSERFNSSPLDFVITVGRCMDAEITLLGSMEEDNSDLRRTEKSSAEVEQKKQFQKTIDELLVSVDQQLKPMVQKVERLLEQMKQKHNRFTIDKRDREIRIGQLRHIISCDGANSETFRKDIETLEKTQVLDEQSIVETQKQIKSSSHNTAESLAGVVQKAWDLLDLWLNDQKLEITCLTPPPDMGQLDALDNIFKATNEQFQRVILLQEGIQKEFDRVKVPPFPTENEELTNNLKIILEKHIDRMFVVERQPNRIKKITQRKSLSNNMIVRMLGGVSFGIGEMNQPRVTARIFPEKDGALRAALEYQGPHDDPTQIPGGIAEVGNGHSVLEKQRATLNVIAVFNSYQLRKVKRICNERIGKEERVTDQKYALVYYTCVRVMDRDYQLKAMSLPICLNTSNSQEGPSKGTLIWEAAFPVENREPWSFADKDQAKWPDVVTLINALFQRHTDRPLTPEQLGYLAERLMDARVGTKLEEMTEMTVLKDRFLKDNMANCSFTFWKWVYACLNLIKSRLKDEWKKGLIFGFVGRPLTKALLRERPRGTFLLRFSDFSIEDTQSSEVPGCLTVAVVHENPKKPGKKKVTFVTDFLKVEYLRKHGLAEILEGYCYRDPQNREVSKSLVSVVVNAEKRGIAFEDAFKQYLVRKDEKRDGYAKTKMKIEVDLEDQQDAKSAAKSRAESMCAASPTSVNSDTSAGSSMETDMAVLDFVVGSPSNSEVSVISQALSPVEISNEPENTELLSPQEQDTILTMLQEKGIQLNVQTPSQIQTLLALAESSTLGQSSASGHP